MKAPFYIRRHDADLMSYTTIELFTRQGTTGDLDFLFSYSRKGVESDLDRSHMSQDTIDLTRLVSNGVRIIPWRDQL
jgi:hypothetical protein